jgi:hypothetical protein
MYVYAPGVARDSAATVTRLASRILVVLALSIEAPSVIKIGATEF